MPLAILQFELFLHLYVHFDNAIMKYNFRSLLIHYITTRHVWNNNNLDNINKTNLSSNTFGI